MTNTESKPDPNSKPSHTDLPEENYIRLHLRGLARENEDDLTSFCFENGAQGVAEDLAFTQPELVYEAKVVAADRFDLNVFFATEPTPEFMAELRQRFPEAVASVHIEPTQDWMENWKKGFEPFLFVDPFWIVPSWREVPPQAKQVLWVDPGMAFGTGTHETTRLAASLIVQAWPKVRDAAASPNAEGGALSVLDVGTGTGILALVAARLGAGRVVAVDNDAEARRVARENVALNLANLVEIPEADISEIEERFDLVVANIIDGVLLNLKDDLLARLKPGGTLVLSGILTEREEPFLAGFLSGAAERMRNRRRVTMGEWSAFLIR